MDQRQSNVFARSRSYKFFSGTREPLWAFLILFLFAVVIALATEPEFFQEETEVLAPRTYEAVYASTPILIDGKDDDAAWEVAGFSEKFIDIEGVKTPRYDTRVKMLWDHTYFYFYAEMQEPHVWATLQQRDTVIFYNNDFEIFIDPDGDTHEYYEFEMNALNTVWDLLLVKPYRNGGSVLDHWDIHGLQSAVHIDGTLNDAGDVDTGWSVEVAIPWEVLSEAAHMPVPPEGTFWRVNFSRVNWDFQWDGKKYSRKQDEEGNFLSEYNWVWSPQQVVNMHEPERWGYVYFKPQGEEATFEIPEAEKVKWELYAVYRRLIKNKKSTWSDEQKDFVELPAFFVAGEKVEVGVEFHAGGWNLIAPDPSGSGLHIISEDGKYRFKN